MVWCRNPLLFCYLKACGNSFVNSESRSKYANSNSHFLKDLQTEFQNWEAGLNSDQKPKSLREELTAIGEEFVEFLENELKIDDSNSEGNTQFGGQTKNGKDDKTAENSFDDGVSEVEAALEKLTWTLLNHCWGN